MSAVSTVPILRERLEKALENKNSEQSVDESLIQDCFDRLEEVQMTLGILTETLIGATVNKFKSHAVWGPTAKALVKKWKQIAKKQQQPSTNAAAAAAAAAAAKTTNTNSSSSQTTGMRAAADDPDQAAFSPANEWADLPPNRQAMCEKLHPLLLKATPDLIQVGMSATAIQDCLAKLAAELESAIYEHAKSDRNIYIAKTRSIAFNIKRNADLVTNLVLGSLQVDEVAAASAEDLVSDVQRQEREQRLAKLSDAKRLDWDQANEEKINKMCGIQGDLLKASLFTCGRCKSVKTTSTQKQTRSADEPMTVFVLCLNCGKRWKC